MQKADAQLICRKTEYGPICKWEGGKFAQVNAEMIFFAIDPLQKQSIKAGMVFEFGRIKMRVVAFPVFSDMAYCDNALVMLESPYAQLYWLYREHAEKLVKLVAQVEARLLVAWRGLMLRKSPEGETLRLTSRIADRLL